MLRTASKVSVPSNVVIAQFRDAVKAKYADSHLKGIDPSNLLVYADKTALDANTADVHTNLKSSRSLKEGENETVGLGPDADHTLVVVVPEGVPDTLKGSLLRLNRVSPAFQLHPSGNPFAFVLISKHRVSVPQRTSCTPFVLLNASQLDWTIDSQESCRGALPQLKQWRIQDAIAA